jgi:hypothetical protein
VRIRQREQAASGSGGENEGPCFQPGFSLLIRHPVDPSMNPSSFTLGSVLLFGSGLFVLATLYFGTRGGYYDTDDYDGNGTAH